MHQFQFSRFLSKLHDSPSQRFAIRDSRFDNLRSSDQTIGTLGKEGKINVSTEKTKRTEGRES